MKVVKLRPSAGRASVALLLMITSWMVARGAIATGSYFWPRTGALVGLVAFGLLMVWFIYVPVELEFDRVDVTIRYRFRRRRSFQWYELEYYGRRGSVFVLQFAGRTFKLFWQAFAPADWYELVSFLDDRYPERKADGWLRGKGFRWPGR
jgi:hypothetical protein